MVNRIGGHSRGAMSVGHKTMAKAEQEKKGTFKKVLSGSVDVALQATSAVAPALLPGGTLLKMGADKLYQLKNGEQAQGQELDKMWQMQQDSQMFNMQYMQLQQRIQADNRDFSAMSNLLKVRHDTAKAAINNMHA
ncbi:MAG: hypothetical protein AAGI01_00780 [Myxococcota bacterium]